MTFAEVCPSIRCKASTFTPAEIASDGLGDGRLASVAGDEVKRAETAPVPGDNTPTFQHACSAKPTTQWEQMGVTHNFETVGQSH